MMKLWVPTRPMPNHSNYYWVIFSNTLYTRHYNSLLISYPHLPRRKLRLTYPLYTCQWCIHILYLSLPSCRPRACITTPSS
uniref:Uncharacterized protein n=1 Tax=Spermophilus dauricus TaxID=99837 RepID=A0A8C9Q8S9_SPEDA